MVVLKRTAVDASVPLRRSPTSHRLIPFGSAAVGKGSRVQCKSVCRSDQRSAVSIAGSSSSNNDGGSSDRPEQPPAQQTAGGGGGRHYRRRNAIASCSAAAAEPPNENSSPPQDCVTHETAGRRLAFNLHMGRNSRSSCGNNRTGKSVSIATSQEANSCQGREVNSHVRVPSEFATKSIIKMKPLPLLSHFGSSTNNVNNGTQTRDPGENSDTTQLHARDQKIFRECRFIPRDSFYKKVLVAPNQERQFFSAPKSIRGPGSRLFYDISRENFRHHQDCNIDLTRDMLKKSCSNYCRPSQFRHVY